MLDVLMYLFEHYMDESTVIAADNEDLLSHLSDVGFSSHEIDKAMSWMDGLVTIQGASKALKTNNSLRLYSQQECLQLDRSCRGYLQFLETSGILTPEARELVIDRALALDHDEIDLDKLKWVILMVLFNQPQQGKSPNWMEDLVFAEPATSIH
jgi:Smg protein